MTGNLRNHRLGFLDKSKGSTRLRRVFSGQSSHTKFRLAVLNIPFMDDECAVCEWNVTNSHLFEHVHYEMRSRGELVASQIGRRHHFCIRASSELLPWSCRANLGKFSSSAFSEVTSSASSNHDCTINRVANRRGIFPKFGRGRRGKITVFGDNFKVNSFNWHPVRSCSLPSSSGT